MKKFKKFIPWKEGSTAGYYYTSYDPETREGEGWFGTEQEVSYYFRDEIRYNPDLGAEELMSQTCGVGQGCFWTEWR